MQRKPASTEVGAAFARFFFRGNGPSHSVLTRAFAASGFAADDPYDEVAREPKKQQRVLTVFRAAVRRPVHGRKLVEEILVCLRGEGYLDPESNRFNSDVVNALRYALDESMRISSQDLLPPISYSEQPVRAATTSLPSSAFGDAVSSDSLCAWTG